MGNREKRALADGLRAKLKGLASMRSKSMLELLLACATLPGCRQGAEIKVEQNAGGTRFTVERPAASPRVSAP